MHSLVHILSEEILGVLPPSMRTIRHEMRTLAQSELTVAQFRVLTRLDHSAHTNKQLAEWMGISPASMCRTVNILTQKGFVSRTHAQADRREVVLVLTQQGKKKYESIKHSTQKILEKKLASLSKKNQQELLNGLKHLRSIFIP